MRKTILCFLVFTLVGCSYEVPEERDPVPPSAAPASSTPTAPPSEPDAPPNCAAVESWCGTPYVWPLDPFSQPDVPQQCYCMCDINAQDPQPACASSPQPSECGAIFEIVAGDAGPEKAPRFPNAYPFVCRYSEFQQAQ
jgi:hypothetical protein